MVLKVGVVGGNGNFGLKRLRAVIKGGDLIQVVCDKNFDKVKEIAGDACSYVYSYKDMINYDLDAIIISTPDHIKDEIITFFLENSFNVLVEKPLANTKYLASKYHQLASKKNVVLYTGYNVRQFPSVQKLRNLHDNNYFGQLFHVRMFYGHGGINAFERDLNWRTGSTSWGGSFIDMGSHLLNLCHELIGLSKNLEEIHFRKVFFKNIESHCDLSFKVDKTLFSITSSWSAWRSQFSADVYGDKGFARLESLMKYIKYGQAGEKITFGKRNINGAPETEVVRWNPYEAEEKMQESVEIFDVDTEFLRQDWWNFKGHIKNKSNGQNNKLIESDIFVAQFLEQYEKY